MTNQSILFLVPFLLSVVISGCCFGVQAAAASDGGGHQLEGSASKAVTQYCAGWVMNADSNNIQGWSVTPPQCQGYIKKYIQGGQYLVDFQIALDAANVFLHSLEPVDGKAAVVFDIDETSLSNLAYYKNYSYGGEPFVATVYDTFVDKASDPALPTLALYQMLVAESWKLIFITGRDEIQRNVTTQNLLAAGYTNWSELILRQPDEDGLSAAVYKSNRRAELEKKGYSIKSCLGDQWSDCEGAATGNRTFKLPNPMYYIA